MEGGGRGGNTSQFKRLRLNARSPLEGLSDGQPLAAGRVSNQLRYNFHRYIKKEVDSTYPKEKFDQV